LRRRRAVADLRRETALLWKAAVLRALRRHAAGGMRRGARLRDGRWRDRRRQHHGRLERWRRGRARDRSRLYRRGRHGLGPRVGSGHDLRRSEERREGIDDTSEEYTKNRSVNGTVL